MSVVENLLDSGGIEYRHLGKQDEIKICCPFCEDSGESADTRFRLGINVEKEVSHCYNCGYKAAGGMLLQELAEKFNVSLTRTRLKITKPKEEVIEELPEGALPIEYESLIGQLDYIGTKARKYLVKRNVPMWQIIRHQIGYAETGKFGHRIIFPVLDSEKVLRGFVARSFGKREPKYLNSEGLKLLWNAYHRGKVAIVCEGIMDAMAVERAVLTEMPDAVALARLGSAITPYQMQQLKRYKRVIVIPDWDVPGVDGASKLLEQVAETHKDVRVCIPLRMDDSDPGSIDEATICSLLADAEPWSAGTKFKMRLAKMRTT